MSLGSSFFRLRVRVTKLDIVGHMPGGRVAIVHVKARGKV